MDKKTGSCSEVQFVVQSKCKRPEPTQNGGYQRLLPREREMLNLDLKLEEK